MVIISPSYCPLQYMQLGLIGEEDFRTLKMVFWRNNETLFC